MSPEDFCYIGVEPSPDFQMALHELQDRSMGRKVHFFEAAAGPRHGPISFHMDLHSQPRYGSSLFRSHSDIMSG